MKLRFIISLLALTLSFSQLSAQRKNKAYLDYIEKYSSLAVKHQKQYGKILYISKYRGQLGMKNRFVHFILPSSFPIFVEYIRYGSA